MPKNTQVFPVKDGADFSTLWLASTNLQKWCIANSSLGDTIKVAYVFEGDTAFDSFLVVAYVRLRDPEVVVFCKYSVDGDCIRPTLNGSGFARDLCAMLRYGRCTRLGAMPAMPAYLHSGPLYISEARAQTQVISR